MHSIVVESITPAKAKEMLASMVNNRDMSQSKVIEYAIAMDEGRWSLNGETIKFDKDGRLFDGQNRLNGCILADKPFRTYVVRGIEDPEAFSTVDVGKNRSGADIFGIAGFVSPWVASGAATIIYSFKHTKISWNGPIERRTRLKKSLLGQRILSERTLRGASNIGSSSTLSKQELVAFSNTIRDELMSACRYAQASKANRVVGVSTLAGLFYLFREKNAVEAHAFFDQLGEGAGLAATDPILHLRNRLQEYRSKRGTGQKVSRWYWVGLIVKTWNRRRAGVPTRKLYVAENEAFPMKIE